MEKKRLITLFVTLFCIGFLQTSYCQSLKMRLQTRMGYLWNEEDHGKAECELLSLALNGSFNKEFYFSAFQHFNRFDRVTKEDPLGATDWLYLGWRRNNLEFSAGKQMLEYGGHEYDAAPIDLYGAGVYWSNFLYAFSYSANASYWVGNHKLTCQVAEIPIENEHNDLAVSLSWRGKSKWYEAKHSINVIGQGEGKPALSNLVLGNQFSWKYATTFIDIINRWNNGSVKFFRDFSIVACTTLHPTKNLNIQLKYNYDYNHNTVDQLCPIGTHQSKYLTALEYYPMKDDDRIRLHLSYKHDQISYVSAGFTWKIHFKSIPLFKQKRA